MNYRTEQRPEDAVAAWVDDAEHVEAAHEIGIPEPVMTTGELIDAAAADNYDRSQPVRLATPDGSELVVCGLRTVSAFSGGIVLTTRPAETDDEDSDTATVTRSDLAVLLRRWITNYCGPRHILLGAVSDDLAAELIDRAGTNQRGRLQVIVHRALRRLVGSGRLHKPDALRFALIGAIGAP